MRLKAVFSCDGANIEIGYEAEEVPVVARRTEGAISLFPAQATKRDKPAQIDLGKEKRRATGR